MPFDGHAEDWGDPGDKGNRVSRLSQWIDDIAITALFLLSAAMWVGLFVFLF